MTTPKLTDFQRSLLCWLDATDGKLPFEGMKETNLELVYELTLTLKNLGYTTVEPVYEVGFGWVYPLNEAGKALATETRYSSTDCPACVRAFCVCNVRIVCMRGCDRAGCHGSHE